MSAEAAAATGREQRYDGATMLCLHMECPHMLLNPASVDGIRWTSSETASCLSLITKTERYFDWGAVTLTYPFTAAFMYKGTTVFSFLFLILIYSRSTTARDYRKALLFGKTVREDPATLSTRSDKKKKDTMGQCLSGSPAQDIINDVWQAAGKATASANAAVYEKLPSNAERVTVRNVYDGDTLTLIDERRVRLLGIDTPEIKERQPFAQEAKMYTKDRCHKKQIWISFDGAREDHYGRLLAFVWVQEPNGFLCINEGIVAEGLARVYQPNKKSQLKNWKTLLQHQSQARMAKKGLWKDFKDETVYKTTNGSAYHRKDCEHIAKVRRLTPLLASDAITQGLHPCRTCYE